ncbi:lysine-specific histone demethylase 1A-like [Physella acuta]|uniref:lysine-specific histone demethylase 1A-like n=1 Tax=Physella acuta TaxID=109671 RepID=UPI0027DBA4C3|nr:lysine-specific histone demethylase 1A-like [Physella acuta]XP_059152256.1 lysine-specific histone demethylase 1A-like [Physella acuta]XP_059152257.1 lysine-specific histone demethylase 1A-like [Physella acuta]
MQKFNYLAGFIFLNLIIIAKATSNKKSKNKINDKLEKPIVNENQVGLPTEVVIIGSGIAGLAAARKLSSDRSNFTVKVYEARKDRFGGRVWTDRLKNTNAKGVEIDLGGSAFNVIAKNNPLMELADNFELKSTPIDNMQFIVPWEDKRYSGDELTKITRQAAQILSQALNESKLSKLEISVKDAVDRVLNKGDIAKADSVEAHLAKCLPSYILGDYSMRHYNPELLDVGFEKVLLDGMGELLDRLLSGSLEEPPLHLYLNKVARQIKINKEDKKVLIRFRDGTQISADVVIVAVPSTVIGSGDLLFEPKLPKKYQLAAKEISMSAGNKVIVQFERAFWPAEHGVFVRAVSKDAERGNLQTWVNVHKIIGKPYLSSFLTGTAAQEFEKLTDKEAKKLVLAVLTEMFGEDKVQQGGKIVGLQRSHWVADEWSKGASTYPKVGSDPSLWDVFAQPLCPYIYFVGEHTSFSEHGTLHGAYNSGIRAGNQILTRTCDAIMEEKRRKAEERRKKKEAKKNKTENKKEVVSDKDESDEDENGEEENVERKEQLKKEINDEL